MKTITAILLAVVFGAALGYDAGFKVGQSRGYVQAKNECIGDIKKMSKVLDAGWATACGIELLTRDCPEHRRR